ncbi:hypothetical protein SS1G_12986 [Sclerotinia sclerotiorum 1980 UF-70]|uniref:Carrier domain-containing protein n=1 Tax=Sclerotinia sclerotiorum (strain ATCC 18683 / 1980 / Ss-1) TaxID=665079 RepID=A7F5V8_SCLS1|nr:hypothetical protein SS1G_12986 [Sclerotinia sclerotiorum 1980 UF-70]EDN98129.1 hypothetical protein SS1G_12986 [Sclerotinia sclerotiorum 1980 UF-70]
MAANHESVAQWQDALLPHVVDRLARDRPDVKYGEWVTSSSVITITYAQLANIINCLAWLLVEQLNGPGSYGAHAEVLAYVGANDTPGEIPSVNSLISGKRVIVTLPPFHGALLVQLLVGAIPYGNVVIATVASPIPTVQGVVDALKQSPADVAILVPSVVAELAHNEELLDYCAINLKTIIYIGGDLPQDLGDRVASRIYLRCLWGATETGIVPQLLPSALGRTLWRYVKFHPCIGAIFDKTTSGIYELGIQRKKALADMQPCFTVPGMQQLEEYRTKDLFEPHPSIPDLWCWRARSDDIIVFLNGEKTNPISMEQHIMASNPEVSGALVVGAQKFQAALLIEPVSDLPLTTANRAALIERIWPSIEESNRTAPAHARVEKSFVLVIPMGRRPIRAPKGTFMHGANISQYTKEIEKLYKDADVLSINNDDLASDTRQHVAPTGLDGTTHLVRQQTLAVTDWPSLDNDDNLFDRGMDSLQGLQLTRALRRIFYHPDFALSTVYQNPTVSQLVAAILTPNETVQSEQTSEHPKQASEQINVLLTGSTGIIVRFIFISSIAAVEGHRYGAAPEQILESLDTPAPFGYGRAKFLAELLVDAGGRHLGNKVPTTVMRVGHVAGPVHSPGIWNPREWLPSLVLSSLHLGQIPDSLGPGFNNVDFVPVDLLSDILVELATAATTQTAHNAATVFNVRNPQLVSWSTLLSAIVAIQPLQVVSPATWLASLRASSEADYEDEDVAANQAVKLPDFFEGLWAIHADTEKVSVQPMVMEKALEASPAMRKLDAVKVE